MGLSGKLELGFTTLMDGNNPVFFPEVKAFCCVRVDGAVKFGITTDDVEVAMGFKLSKALLAVGDEGILAPDIVTCGDGGLEIEGEGGSTDGDGGILFDTARDGDGGITGSDIIREGEGGIVAGLLTV